jgi:hypothetical protein
MIKTILVLPKVARNRMFNMEDLSDNSWVQSERVPVNLFFLTIFFYIAYQLVMQPSWVLGGEMWAEMATNYFLNANSSSYLEKILATDSGYIPVPQRLIAFIGHIFNLPASSIPYFYTWMAIFLTAIMIGAFCLAQFRVLVKSDAMRFFTAIAILIVADFETRTFINFTYFSVFFVAIITALALVDDSKEVPFWAWFIPVLMVSKPAVIAILPVMIIVGMIRNSRFRWITVVVVTLCFGQIIQMVISSIGGVMPFRMNDVTFLSKIIASVKYFFGFLGGYVAGQNHQMGSYFSILVGITVFILCGIVLFKKRNKAGALIVIGLSLLFFNVLLNCFTLSDSWNRNMVRLIDLPVYRHIIVGFIGCILIVVGILASLTDQMRDISKSGFVISLGAIIFLIWFVACGWLSFGTKISREPVSAMINNSQWQSMSKIIDLSDSDFCIPIDPIGWQYGKNCTILNPSMTMFNIVQESQGIISVNGNYTFNYTPPDWLSHQYIMSIGILIKPSSLKTTRVVAKATLLSNNGDHLEMFGERVLPLTGGLLNLSGVAGTKIKGVNSVKIDFNVPVEVKFVSESSITSPAILWMGQFVSKAAEIYEGKIIYQPSQNRGKEDGLFLVKNGIRRWIASPEWISRNGFKQTDIVQISSSDFFSIVEDSEALTN